MKMKNNNYTPRELNFVKKVRDLKLMSGNTRRARKMGAVVGVHTCSLVGVSRDVVEDHHSALM